MYLRMPHPWKSSKPGWKVSLSTAGRLHYMIFKGAFQLKPAYDFLKFLCPVYSASSSASKQLSFLLKNIIDKDFFISPSGHLYVKCSTISQKHSSVLKCVPRPWQEQIDSLLHNKGPFNGKWTSTCLTSINQ